MQRDDLRVVSTQPCGHMCSCSIEHYRPATTAEQLKALGAIQKWWCKNGDRKCEWWNDDTKDHSTCGWVWIVEEDR